MSFSKTHQAGLARAGRLETAHGSIETPAFMPVGTRATVKTLTPDEVADTGTQILVSNVYHLAIRPGIEIIREAGGLHRFMAWPGVILTDSGGYQVFSLSTLRELTDLGAHFRSHLDGAAMFLGPAEVMSIQKDLGSDIAMIFDDCPPYPCDRDRAQESLTRTSAWAAACREQPRADGQLVFGIGQGSVFRDLREQAMAELVALDFDGYAIGGLSVGEPEPMMLEVLDWVVPTMPDDKIRYLMGVGTPPQIVEAVARGLDLFDCVLPTRVGRNGGAYTRTGMQQIKASRYKNDHTPIDEDCPCLACRTFTRSYIRHLLNVGEFLGMRLLSLHNLVFYQRLMSDIRSAVAAGTFPEFRHEFGRRYGVVAESD